MKKLMFAMLIGLFSTALMAQIAVPAAVKTAFAKKFPTATKVNWGKEAAKEYEAEFTLDGSPISANFAEDGTWLETEKMIKSADLPKAVAAAIQSKYSGWVIAEADQTETAKHGRIYEADLKKGKEKKSAAFKEDGTPVKE